MRDELGRSGTINLHPLWLPLFSHKPEIVPCSIFCWNTADKQTSWLLCICLKIKDTVILGRCATRPDQRRSKHFTSERFRHSELILDLNSGLQSNCDRFLTILHDLRFHDDMHIRIYPLRGYMRFFEKKGGICGLNQENFPNILYRISFQSCSRVSKTIENYRGVRTK